MEKMWLRCETISDGKAMEKSRDYDEEVEKNNGKHIGKIAALMWDQNDAKKTKSKMTEIDGMETQWKN